MKCIKCGHDKERHFDLTDEDSGGNLRADWGCWECEDQRKLSIKIGSHRFEEDNQK